MMISKDSQYIKTMLDNNLFAVIYPKDKTQKSAIQMANTITSAAGVVKLKDENNNFIWGVLIDKIKEGERCMLIKEN